MGGRLHCNEHSEPNHPNSPSRGAPFFGVASWRSLTPSRPRPSGPARTSAQPRFGRVASEYERWIARIDASDPAAAKGKAQDLL